MNLSDEIRKQIEKNKGLKLAVGEINNHLSILENLVRKDIMEQVDEAYQKGLEEGKKAFDLLDAERDSEYQRGLDDAWGAAKKIALMDTETSENVTGYFGLFRIMDNLTASEAIAKLKAYEEKQSDKIKRGDIVNVEGCCDDNLLGVVTKVWEDNCYIMWGDGSGGAWSKDSVVKTGKHIDIDKILEELRYDG